MHWHVAAPPEPRQTPEPGAHERELTPPQSAAVTQLCPCGVGGGGVGSLHPHTLTAAPLPSVCGTHTGV